MIEYGMQTLIELPNLDDCAALCRELGFKFIEINMNLPQYQPEQIDIARFCEIANKYGIYYTIHLDENLNISDFNRRVAKAYLDTVSETIDIAKELNAPVLNMHLSNGVYFTLPEKKVYLFDENEELYLKSIHEFRDMVSHKIGDGKIKVCIENSSGYKSFHIKALDLFFESKIFALTFDIGHNHGIGGADESIILNHADRLCHMHMHDALGKQNHLPLGDGEINLRKYFDLAKAHNCRAVLETKTVAGLKKTVKWLEKEKIR